MSARVHPGESNASWMMRGFLRFMLSDDPVAASLRSAYVFKVVPMLNADGVVIGNYRCNLASHDLNRLWAWPKSDSSPTILGLKRLISECRGDVRVYCDLHGHSRSKNVFIYGCDERVKAIPKSMPDAQVDLWEDGASVDDVVPANPHLEIPYLMHDLCAHFSFCQCSFKVQKSKSSTGRVVVWKNLQVPASFTIEASLCGSSFDGGMHFSTEHLENVGECLARAIHTQSHPSCRARVIRARRELKDLLPEKYAPKKKKEKEKEDKDKGPAGDGAAAGAKRTKGKQSRAKRSDSIDKKKSKSSPKSKGRRSRRRRSASS